MLGSGNQRNGLVDPYLQSLGRIVILGPAVVALAVSSIFAAFDFRGEAWGFLNHVDVPGPIDDGYRLISAHSGAEAASTFVLTYCAQLALFLMSLLGPLVPLVLRGERPTWRAKTVPPGTQTIWAIGIIACIGIFVLILWGGFFSETSIGGSVVAAGFVGIVGLAVMYGGVNAASMLFIALLIIEKTGGNIGPDTGLSER